MARHFGLPRRETEPTTDRDSLLNLGAIMFIAAVYLGAAIGLIVYAVKSARADDPNHQHGVNVPDWYDANCCDRQDCRPVADSDIEFGLDEFGGPVVIHKPTGIAFEKRQWRVSKDERYHPCFRGPYATGPKGEPIYNVYCIYLPAGA